MSWFTGKKLCPYCLAAAKFKKRKSGDYYCPQCPAGEKFRIPRGYVEAYHSFPPEVAAFVAARGHGKTTTLAALLYALHSSRIPLNEKWSHFSCTPLNKPSAEYVRHIKILLDSLRLPKPQPPQRKRYPAILRLADIPDGYNCTLLAFDSSGEDNADEESMARYSPQLKHARTAILLISAPKIESDAPHTTIADEMLELLGTYTRCLERLRARTENQRLIVVFTMADEMQNHFQGEWADLYDSLHVEGNIKSFLVNEQYMSEVQALSARLCEFAWNGLQAQRFVAEAFRMFKSVDFSMISALGQSPQVIENMVDGMRIRTSQLGERIRPLRILDPLLMTIDKTHTPLSLRIRDLAQSVRGQAGATFKEILVGTES